MLIKVGTFYESFHDDACIVAYFMSYKLRDGNYKSCGFPSNSLNRVLSVLDVNVNIKTLKNVKVKTL